MNPAVTRLIRFAYAFGLLSVSSASALSQTNPSAPAKLWVTAYYSTWGASTMPPEKIDFSAMTEVEHAFITPNPDGTVTGITPAESKTLIDMAHAAGCKVLVSVGGENSRPSFEPVLSDAVRPTFLRNLLLLVMARGYDGVDIDMEPIQDSDIPAYTSFIEELRKALNDVKPGMALTAAVEWEPQLFASLQSQFDQINIMTYVMSGPWEGFNTWFNSPLNAPTNQSMPGGPYPSDLDLIDSFIKAGVSPGKIGFGIPFFGEVWTGATGPKQSIAGTAMTETDYHDIMDTYYLPSAYNWDAVAAVPYLSIAAPQKAFVSYDDERSCSAKVDWSVKHGLGGVMIWELAGGYRANQPEGQRQKLLEAVKKAVDGTAVASP